MKSDSAFVGMTDYAKEMIYDRYQYRTSLDEPKDFTEPFRRVAKHLSDDIAHEERLYDYMAKGWFRPATPVLSNIGTPRGLPISCFLNSCGDSLEEIAYCWNENIWLAAKGGGVGTYWGHVRSVGETVRATDKTTGVVPFINVQNALTTAISQGALRRGSAAVYLPIHHPEIEEFLDIRKPTGGDISRKSLNIHHGVSITDDFMHAVQANDNFALRSPKTKQVMREVSARELWIELLSARLQTGEPYMLFIDTVNKLRPEIYKRLDIKVETSNLCAEIMQCTTGRVASCVLSSVNAEHYDAWKSHPTFIEDIMRMLDNICSYAIEWAPKMIAQHPVGHSIAEGIRRERSVGLGLMGLHSYFQQKMLPFDSEEARDINKEIFMHMRTKADLASWKLAKERGACLDGIDAGIMERFTHKLAVAPTASISTLAGSVSPCVEPYLGNAFTHKTLSGSHMFRNRHLEKLLESKGKNTLDVWNFIAGNGGSVQNISFLTAHEKECFRTAFEIDQKAIIDMAADRGQYVCQGQSINLFFVPSVHKKVLHDIHMNAWKSGTIKSLYYCRSFAVNRSDNVLAMDKTATPMCALQSDDGECGSCQ